MERDMEQERLGLGRVARPAALMIAAVIEMIWFAFARTACLSGTNPKNIGLLASACLVIAQSALSGAQAWIVLAVFVFVSCISVIVPVLYYFIAGASAEKTLTGWKTWLAANNGTVMVALLPAGSSAAK